MATVLEAPATIRHKLASARLPALPQVVLQVMQQCEDEAAGLAEIAAIVGRDAAISAQVVRVAHSPYYNRGRSLEGLNQCLAVLGTQTVRRIAINQAILDLLGRFQGAARVDLVPFWCHALLSAHLAQRLAVELGYPRAEEAYLAGLLHDIGRLALLAAAPDAYAPLFDREAQTSLDEERSRFGLTHAEAGGWLAERWRLDPLFCDSLRYHHEDGSRVRDAHTLVQIVYLANQLARRGPAEIDAGIWGLDAARLEALLADAQTAFRQSAEAFGVPLTEAEREIAKTLTDRDAATHALAQAAEARLLAQGACAGDSPPDAESQALVTIVRGASLIFGTGRAAWLQLTEGALRGVSPDGQDPRLQEIRIPLPATTSRIALALQQPMVLGADEAELGLMDRHLAHLLATPALLCLGLAHAGEHLGVMVLALDETAANALRARTALVSSFAAEAARLLGEARARAQSLREARNAIEETHRLRARQVIHEVANPLGVVHNYLALLRDRLGDDSGTTADIDLMREELRRVGGILEQLRQSEPRATTTSETVDLNALIRHVVELSRRGKPEMARVETYYHLEEGLPAVRSDRNKLKQILLNLVFNAVEAMPEGGRLTLSSAYWRSGRQQGQVELGVEDTGPGIPDEVLQHLYSPVVSRKGGAHAGMGLAIVGRLVEELGAVIQCHSTRVGTRFKLLLPVRTGPLESQT